MASPTTTSVDSYKQEPWLPFNEPTKDCSQGFCSIYCPQWCYIIFPPPPPFLFSDDDNNNQSSSSSGPSFSPLVITIIGVLASAFLLVSYYTIISKYCVSFNTLRRRFLRRHGDHADVEDQEDLPGGASSRRHETWYNSPSNGGLDETLIDKITVCRYKRDDGLIDSGECSVCLSEFREDESLRLLPKCSHAFHLHCIDTWLKSHSNCPLCRACIISVINNPLAPPEEPPETTSTTTTTTVQLPAVAIEESNVDTREEEEEEENEEAEDHDHKIDVVKDQEEDGRVIEVIRRSFSMDSSLTSHRRGGRVSIADVLRLSVDDDDDDDEYDHELFIVAGEINKGSSSSTSRNDDEISNKRSSRSGTLHCVMSPVPMKRSFSSGRFCFTARNAIHANHSRGKSSLLPL